MRQKKSTLLFTVENKIVAREHKESEKTGLENCRRRLRLLYPGRHRLRINDTGEVFKVELGIVT